MKPSRKKCECGRLDCMVFWLIWLSSLWTEGEKMRLRVRRRRGGSVISSEAALLDREGRTFQRGRDCISRYRGDEPQTIFPTSCCSAFGYDRIELLPSLLPSFTSYYPYSPDNASRCHLQRAKYPLNDCAEEYPFPREKAPGLSPHIHEHFCSNRCS